MRTRHINVRVDLDRIAANAEAIARSTRVPVVAVVKADAYGCGALRVCEALAGVVSEFAYFYVNEAREIGRGGVVLGPPDGDPDEYRDLGLRPSIGTRQDAKRFAGLRVAINVDSGMQRFGCAPGEIDEIARRCGSDCEFHTHADSLEAVRRFKAACGGRGGRLLAACSSLLHEPEAWLDGVRPGIALYRGAVRVAARLVVLRELSGPAGYTRFNARHVGVVLGGYSNHLHSAPVTINGRRQRVLEVGMNTSFVSVDPADRVGDEVVLLGDGLTEKEVGDDLRIREHEVLCRYTSSGNRVYLSGGRVLS